MLENNKLISSQNIGMTQQEELIFQQLFFKKVISIETMLRQSEDQNKKEIALLTSKIETLENMTEKAIEKEYKIAKSKYEYVNLTELGKHHNIGSIYMGDLLRKLGIARKDTKITTPKAEYRDGVNALARFDVVNERSVCRFHYQRTWEVIHKKLKSLGKLDEFKVCYSQKDVHQFILALKD